AGQMYGAIIYQKAPIVMRQLELMLGPDKFREGLREYLKQFEYGNATWLDLVKVLGSRTDKNAAAWSKTWIEEGGRPSIRVERDDQHLAFVQSDPQPSRELRWTQQMQVLVSTPASVQTLAVEMQKKRTEVKDYASISHPTFVLPTDGGLAYGDFTLDNASR